MRLPQLPSISTSREMTSTFLGYNNNLRISDGQFYDTENTSADAYPVLTTRKRRGLYDTLSHIHGIGGFNKLFYVNGTTFYYNGISKGSVTATDKQFAVMGAYILIFPDKALYDTENDEFKLMENAFTQSGVHFNLCDKDGTAFTDNLYIGSNPPEDTSTYPYWLNNGSIDYVFMAFDTASLTWKKLEKSYVKISYTGIETGFNEGGSVVICDSTTESLNGTNTIQAIGTGYIVISGIISEPYVQVTAVTVKRSIPDMDFVTVSENRCWGCSSENHEIYASKLGDPMNWNEFKGISSDSYAVTIGTEGDFTGAITHLGYVYFFKEDCIHKVYGSMPSNYQTSAIVCDGVEKGSEKSLVTIGGAIYYKARNGVYCFEGSLPYKISDDLGETIYSNAVAGTIGNKLYMCLYDSGVTGCVFTYDTIKKIWHFEDCTDIDFFAKFDGVLYFVSDNAIWVTDSSAVGDDVTLISTESALPWKIQTGKMGLNTPDNKRISKIQIRLKLGANSSVTVYLKCDSGSWVNKGAMSAATVKSVVFPIIPQRCDNFELKLTGSGDFELYSITKTIENGSEI